MDKETELYDYIKTGKKTVADVEKDLGHNHMGAMGKLLQAGKVEKVKLKEGEDGYGIKFVTYYQTTVKKEN